MGKQQEAGSRIQEGRAGKNEIPGRARLAKYDSMHSASHTAMPDKEGMRLNISNLGLRTLKTEDQKNKDDG